MKINRHLPHILILPEDDANRQIANGFILDQNLNKSPIQILPYDRGWENLLKTFINDHLPKIRQFPERRMVLLIDFDRIGETLARDCANKTTELWGHNLLKHNRSELDRMILSVKPFLFVGI